MSNRSINSFSPLKRELLDRLRSPVGSFTFWTYAILGIGICGGLAIWIEGAKYLFGLAGTTSSENLRLAVITYFPAVGCGAAQQLFITEKQRMYLRSFGYAASFGFLGLCILAFLLQPNHPQWSMTVGVIGSIMALTIWWIANGADPTFHDSDPETIVGGSTESKLPGDVSGWDTAQ
jgi:hypothetical protein